MTRTKASISVAQFHNRYKNNQKKLDKLNKFSNQQAVHYNALHLEAKKETIMAQKKNKKLPPVLTIHFCKNKNHLSLKIITKFRQQKIHLFKEQGVIGKNQPRRSHEKKCQRQLKKRSLIKSLKINTQGKLSIEAKKNSMIEIQLVVDNQVMAAITDKFHQLEASQLHQVK